jgi:hypothetical protein
MSDDPFPGSSADFYEQIQVMKAEFQKAKEWNQLCEMQIRNLQEIVASQDQLITELCDALQNGAVIYPYSCEKRDDLVQRAREATR